MCNDMHWFSSPKIHNNNLEKKQSSMLMIQNEKARTFLQIYKERDLKSLYCSTDNYSGPSVSFNRNPVSNSKNLTYDFVPKKCDQRLNYRHWNIKGDIKREIWEVQHFVPMYVQVNLTIHVKNRFPLLSDGWKCGKLFSQEEEKDTRVPPWNGQIVVQHPPCTPGLEI